MNIDAGTVFLFVSGFFLLYLCCRIFLKPIKWLFKTFTLCVAGGVFIAVINLFSDFTGVHFALNPLTSMITGFLGFPGLIMIWVLKIF